MNPFREKLASGKRLLGTHVNLVDHRVCEILGSIGFDYLWIDMEHVSTSFAQMETHLIAARAAGTPTLVRICWNDIPHAKRVLEAGPDAVLFPMINTVEEAQRAIDTCIYPPEGKRGFGPFRAVNYGMSSTEEYIRQGHKEQMRFIQVESKNAVKIMEETAKIPYMDGYVIGPMDLSGSVGRLGDFSGETSDLVDEAVAKAHAAGKPIGLSIGSDTEEELQRWFEKGVDFISAGLDAWSLIRGGREVLSALRNLDRRFPRQTPGK